MTKNTVLATSEKNFSIVIKPANSVSEKTFVVLGVERGGTSMIAAVLRALGINMGEGSGINHEDPVFLSENKSVLLNAIKNKNDANKIWGFKMPKSALDLSFFAENLRNPHFIIVYRNILAITDSWIQRGAGSYFDVVDRALVYYSSIHEFSKSSDFPILAVNYERACDMKEAFVNDICSFVGDKVPIEKRKLAIDMITGDGKGYKNLPEFDHEVSRLSNMSILKGSKESVKFTFPGDPTSHTGAVEYSYEGNKKLIVEPMGGSFPKKFYMLIDCEVSSGFEDKSFLFIDLAGVFTAAHGKKLPIKNGRNIFLVDAQKEVPRVAVGLSSFSKEDNISISIKKFQFVDAKDSKQNLLSRIVELITTASKVFKGN